MTAQKLMWKISTYSAYNTQFAQFEHLKGGLIIDYYKLGLSYAKLSV